MNPTIDTIRTKIRQLYENTPEIHVSITMTHPKLTVTAAPAVIKGVYPNFFRLEENSGGQQKCHTVQYAEVLLGQVKITELGALRTGKLQ